MLRFGKTLGTLDREVYDIKIMNSADPDDFTAICNHDETKAKKAVEKLLHKK